MSQCVTNKGMRFGCFDVSWLMMIFWKVDTVQSEPNQLKLHQYCDFFTPTPNRAIFPKIFCVKQVKTQCWAVWIMAYNLRVRIFDSDCSYRILACIFLDCLPFVISILHVIILKLHSLQTHLNDFTKAAIPNVMNISRRDKARHLPFITRFPNHAFCFRVPPESGRLLQSPCDRSLWPQPLTDLNPI